MAKRCRKSCTRGPVRAPEADLSGQAPEDAMNVLVRQAAALLSDEECRAAAWSEMRIATAGVAAQRGAGRRMQWHEPRKVDVITLEPHRLGQTHACHRDQPEQIMVGPSAQSVF